MFCQKVDLGLEQSLLLLEKAGINVPSPSSIMGEIAKDNGLSPQELYTIMKPAPFTPMENASFPSSPNASFGKQTIQDICTRYTLPQEEVMMALKGQGIQATPEQTVKEIGDANDSNPMVIFEILQKIAEDKEQN